MGLGLGLARARARAETMDGLRVMVGVRASARC